MPIKKRKRGVEPTEVPAQSPSGERTINVPKTRRKEPPASRDNISLVDDINSLPFSEFVDRYIPPYALDLTIRPSRASSNDTTSDATHDAYSVKFYTAASIPAEYMDACFNLIYFTSSEAYNKSASGWSGRKKKLEMKLLDMRYIVLVSENETTSKDPLGISPIGGFLSFMVTQEDELPVLYCYEIHLAPEVQHRGVGKQLLRIFEDIGRNVGLRKGMLTVFKSNQSAVRFYEQIGFTEDESSPKPTRLRNGKMREHDYMIMSQPYADGNEDCMDITDQDLN
ncbi:uncharacterized protein GIQ15_03285 [Arthroderma uncinatum]|uniref:uncharacterized protein n=1 Tax=Arthroderma uncinatum TaxID=74035 RepID=UPI00144AA7AC|nr:uncharacterized protein GIQ15_03285 [Arthroderma uncinatum]KAF3483961.1 hypothetical protein GIQ15_03285 [Arthroderma uncinatum]